LPVHRYDQATLTRAMLAMLDDPEPVRRRVEALHERVRVEMRHLALPIEAYAEITSFGRANAAWVRCATELGERAVDDALARAGLARGDIDLLMTVTVTGVASPSLDALLVDRMGLRPDVKRLPVFGLGCVAGVAGIARAADYLRGHPDGVAVLLSVELCSLTFQRDDVSVANLIATGLFGDGAAAVVLVGAERTAGLATAGPSVRATRSIFYPGTEHVMGWRVDERGFGIVLSDSVPGIARERLGPGVRDFLAEHDLAPADVATWICHPGGPRVLEAMRDALELDDEDVALSWKVLREQGNLSSASVLMVLGEVLHEAARPAPGARGVLVAMGPGFCSEIVLVDW
jgi:alkylresorcinol/alkylpyrone synthase